MKKIKLLIEKKNSLNDGSVSFVFGKVDGTVILQKGANRRHYGASMPKLPMALAQMITMRIKRKNPSAALTNKELSMLLDYSRSSDKEINISGQWYRSSNEMFRGLCGADPDKGTTFRDRVSYTRPKGEPRLGSVSKEEEDEFVTKLGINPKDFRICRHGGGGAYRVRKDGSRPNVQTPMAYFKFLSLLHQADNLAHEQESQLMSLPSKLSNEDSNKIIDTYLRPAFEEVKRLCQGLRKMFKKPSQPERTHFRRIEKAIQKQNLIEISPEIWGKGGVTSSPRVIHMGIVINEEYILSVYTRYPSNISKHARNERFASQVAKLIAKGMLRGAELKHEEDARASFY